MLSWLLLQSSQHRTQLDLLLHCGPSRASLHLWWWRCVRGTECSLVSRLSALENCEQWAQRRCDARPGLGAAGQRLWSRLKHPERFGWLLLNQEEATQELQYGQLLTRKGLSCVNWQWALAGMLRPGLGAADGPSWLSLGRGRRSPSPGLVPRLASLFLRQAWPCRMGAAGRVRGSR